jgi:hypothetical protein
MVLTLTQMQWQHCTQLRVSLIPNMVKHGGLSKQFILISSIKSEAKFASLLFFGWIIYLTLADYKLTVKPSLYEKSSTSITFHFFFSGS